MIIVLAASEAAQSQLGVRPCIWHAGSCCTATLQSKSDETNEVVQKAADGSNRQTRPSLTPLLICPATQTDTVGCHHRCTAKIQTLLAAKLGMFTTNPTQHWHRGQILRGWQQPHLSTELLRGRLALVPHAPRALPIGDAPASRQARPDQFQGIMYPVEPLDAGQLDRWLLTVLLGLDSWQLTALLG